MGPSHEDAVGAHRCLCPSSLILTPDHQAMDGFVLGTSQCGEVQQVRDASTHSRAVGIPENVLIHIKQKHGTLRQKPLVPLT